MLLKIIICYFFLKILNRNASIKQLTNNDLAIVLHRALYVLATMILIYSSDKKLN